ncbi:STAS-like domain-containing protein [Sulfurimonas sp. SAG-AH-194-C20]|nr:STAS-like domain-containing protein [Sulfurimonas sp. SAG-AH-194-C20]MDF1878168.1 STAS-like domain-containing protein [Sulfurimonas sp. SAG-AH-194-C20]
MSVVINIKNETGGFDFVGSRGAGEIVRKRMKKELDKGSTITLDFNGIEQVTQSFIDEFFGIFIRAFGIEYVRGKVRLVNETQGIKDTINFVIKYSKERSA